MIVIDVVAVTVAAVLANHLELIDTMERVVRHKLPVLNCAKCLTFWSTLAVMLSNVESIGKYLTVIVATSFIAAFAAKWIELLFGYIDTLYDKIYEKIYTQNEDCEDETEAGAGATYENNSTSTLS